MAEFDFINDPGFTERPDPLMERFVPKSKEDFPAIPGFGAGKEVLSQMQGAGYSSAEMQDFVTTSARMTLSEGGTPQDVDTFFGVKPFDPAPIREETEKALTRTLARHPEEKNPQRIYELYWQELWTETDEMLAEGSRSWDEIQAGIEAIPQTIEDVKLGLKAGHQSAAIGMALRGGMPDTFLPRTPTVPCDWVHPSETTERMLRSMRPARSWEPEPVPSLDPWPPSWRRRQHLLCPPGCAVA